MLTLALESVCEFRAIKLCLLLKPVFFRKILSAVMHNFAQCKSACLPWTCRYFSFLTVEKRNNNKKKKVKKDTNGDQTLLKRF